MLLYWKTIDHTHEGLPDALGCYIFAIKSGSSILPWYVGKTTQRTFKFETVTSHKILHYESALRLQPDGQPLLYLLPRMTDGGKFRKVWKAGSSSVDRLEGMLIETALMRNPKLSNRKDMKHLTQTIVPGYKNEPKGSRTPEAENLALLLGTPKGQ